jgi:uncharacterized protein with GYD domain
MPSSSRRLTEGGTMVRYVTLLKLTGEGAKAIKDAPKRIDEAVKGLEAMGGKLLDFYVVMGKYDYVAIAEAPSDEVCATFLLALAAGGNVRTMAMKAFTREQFGQIVARLP